MAILIAFLVMLGISLVTGLLLSVLSHFFAVEDDPLKKEIRSVLPGINCGACGYKGCDDYAAALAEGGVKPNLCIPGAQSVADCIANLLGVESEPFEDVVAFVACNGHCDPTSPKAKYEGVQTCKAASAIYGGATSCTYGCLGLGDCANACPSNAICMLDGIAHVDTSRCLGCGLCASICPKNIISMLPQEAKTVVMCNNKQKGADARKVCKNACIACKKCEKSCSFGAITVVDNLAKIDYTKCTYCGDCVKECPTGCLKTVFFPNLPENVECDDLLN